MAEVYYCEQCGRLFDLKDIIIDEELDCGYTHHICPSCGTWDELMEADECKICGEPIIPDTEYCPTCEDILRIGLADTMHSLDCSAEKFQEFCDWLWERGDVDVWREED